MRVCRIFASSLLSGVICLASSSHGEEPRGQPAPSARPGAPRGPSTPPEGAIELHDEARDLYASGRYREAIDRLERAVALDPHGKLLFYNLGLIHEQLGELDEAIANYRRCLELEESAVERRQLARILRRLEGAKALGEVAPQRGAGSPQREDDANRSHLAPWAWASAGVAVGGLAVGGALAAHAASVDPGDGAITGEGVTVHDLEARAREAHASAIAADVFFGVGAAGALASAIIAVVATTEPDGRDHGRVTVVPAAAPGGGGAALVMAF